MGGANSDTGWLEPTVNAVDTIIAFDHFSGFRVQGHADMHVLQPTQSDLSTKTMPSCARFCMAPVGQAATHQGSSQ